MRIYRDFPEAFNEIRRDLAELSVEVHPETMQDKVVADDPDFLTKELSNYDYKVLKPHYEEVPGVHVDYVNQEFKDRIIGELNPGHSWKLRKEVWDEFLEESKNVALGRRFSYTYSERMGGRHVALAIEELKRHPNSRQIWVPVWWPIDESRRGQRRVPCSLGYWMVNREGALHMTYMMRSCDFATHMANDVAMATMLQFHVAREVKLDVGTFTHFIGSLHIYAKDVEGVF